MSEELICPYCNQDHAKDMERSCDVSNLQIKYYNLKQELDAARARERFHIQTQSDLIDRASNFAQQLTDATQRELNLRSDWLEARKQLADLKAQIADYEAALELIAKERKAFGACPIVATETLKKWKAK